MFHMKFEVRFLSIDRCYDFLGECVYISYLAKLTSFPPRSIKRCSLRQNSENSSLNYAVHTHQFLTEPLWGDCRDALLDRRDCFRGHYLCGLHQPLPFPGVEYCSGEGRKGCLSTHKTCCFSIQHQETLLEKSLCRECEIRLCQEESVCMCIEEFCWFSVCQPVFLRFVAW